MKGIFLLGLLCCFLNGGSQTRIVFYLHGRIVEVQGANARDKINGYGDYQYQAIVDTLTKRGFKVFSEVRPADTEVYGYALKLRRQVDSLFKNGTAPADITVIGASKGGYIALELSAQLRNPDMNFVLLGACPGDSRAYYGRMMCILEKSDGFGPCQTLSNRKTLTRYREVTISTGLRHGFLFRPIPEWVEPACDWARQPRTGN